MSFLRSTLNYTTHHNNSTSYKILQHSFSSKNALHLEDAKRLSVYPFFFKYTTTPTWFSGWSVALMRWMRVSNISA